MENIHQYTIQLIRYILNGDQPNLDYEVDFEKLYQFSKSHGIENMIYVAITDLHLAAPNKTIVQFKQAYDAAIMVEAVQALELEAISEAFEKAGIDYIPLKGSVVKYLYPMPDYRKSGDIDILIRTRDKAKIDPIMQELAFTTEKGWDEHDVHAEYKKAQYVHVEVHDRLVSAYERGHAFCDTVWEHVELKKDTEHCYLMENEFLYVYLLSHLCKHLYYGGAGIRLVIDFYLVQQKMDLDFEKLNRFLKWADLYDLYQMFAPIYNHWFGNNEENLTLESKALENIILQGGSFGTREIREELLNSDSVRGKWSRFRRQILPSREWLEMRYSKLSGKKYPLLYLWIYSWVYIIKNKPRKIPIYIRDTFAGKKKNKSLQNIVEAIRIK